LLTRNMNGFEKNLAREGEVLRSFKKNKKEAMVEDATLNRAIRHLTLANEGKKSELRTLRKEGRNMGNVTSHPRNEEALDPTVLSGRGIVHQT